jgi:hypothetical protein
MEIDHIDCLFDQYMTVYAKHAGVANGDAQAFRSVVQPLIATAHTVDDLTTMIRRLVHALRNAGTNHQLADQALGLLRRCDLHGSILRERGTARSGRQDGPHD